MATKKKASKAKKATKKSAKKPSAKRELIAPRSDKRYVRRSKAGRFSESDDQSKSLGKDVRQEAKTQVKSGFGDKGDQE